MSPQISIHSHLGPRSQYKQYDAKNILEKQEALTLVFWTADGISGVALHDRLTEASRRRRRRVRFGMRRDWPSGDGGKCVHLVDIRVDKMD